MARTRIHHFKDYSIKKSGIDIELDMSRVEANVNKAQYALDSAIMTSMVPFMPMDKSSLIKRTRAESAAIAGSGKVVAAVPPYGRFQYMGKVMVGRYSLSPWAKKHEGKIVTDRNLRYSRPAAKAKWFDAAKKKDLKKWVNVVDSEVGGE